MGQFHIYNLWLYLSQSTRLRFPQPKQQEIQKAILNAKKSGFGRNKENVIDESIRLAYQYPRSQISLVSDLIQAITQEVAKEISKKMGSGREVRTELIKLNIYPKGGHFYKHVDSPKKDAFGSLVVFLPCYFQGGDLIVESKYKKKNFSFGGVKGQQNVRWVAFFNDCVHEITEVTQGCRMTLSYNLYYACKQQINFYRKSELVNQLSKLKKNQVYGYYCQHYYNYYNSNYRQNDYLKYFLKGNDYNFYMAALTTGAKRFKLKVLYHQTFNEVKSFDQCCIKALSAPQQEQCKKVMMERVKNDKLEFIGEPKYIYKVQQQSIQLDQEQHYALQYFEVDLWLDYGKIIWLNQKSSSPGYKYALNCYQGNHYEEREQYFEIILLVQF